MRIQKCLEATIILSLILTTISSLEQNVNITACNNPEKSQSITSNYGVDVSWPIHHRDVSTNYPWLHHNIDPINHRTPREFKSMVIQPLGNKQENFEEYLKGCIETYDKEVCIDTDIERIVHNLSPSLRKNYTSTGFLKVRCPDRVYRLLRDFWTKNIKNLDEVEEWSYGGIYTNHWSSPTFMLHAGDETLDGGGGDLEEEVWGGVIDIVSNWTNQELELTSIYGIRIYSSGAILAPHVDRMPLMSSVIINVDQDVDEPWPLEVYDFEGKARNITMVPGDMILYESHTLLHGRPFAMKGRYFANIFVHFKPKHKEEWELTSFDYDDAFDDPRSEDDSRDSSDDNSRDSSDDDSRDSNDSSDGEEE